MNESEVSSTTREKHLWPDTAGHYGRYGGKYVPETLMYALQELEAAQKHSDGMTIGVKRSA